MKKSRFAHLRAVQAVSIAVLAVIASFLSQPVAHADTKTYKLTYDSQAWYWSSQKDFRLCDPFANSGFCSPVSGQVLQEGPITPGHLAVAIQNGKSNMRSYVQFLFGPDLIGAQANSFKVTFTISRLNDGNTAHEQEHAGTGGKPAATINDAGAKVKACLMKIAFGPAAGAPPEEIADSHDPTVTRPSEPIAIGGVDEGTCVNATLTTAKMTFDLTPMARLWFSGQKENDGVAILPVEGAATDNWTIEFHGAAYSVVDSTGTGRVTYVSPAEEAVGVLSYVPPPVENNPPPPPPAPPPPPPPPVDTGPPPAPVVVPTESPTPAPAPQLPVATPHPRTPWYFWLMFPVGLVGFVAMSRAIGHEGGAEGVNRVATVLRERRKNSSGE